ncbi:MAG: hypothetical protein HYV78_01960, partial [Candidatus Wildermuthbacteria bacterium]|nr:hypothetical protein [Candidatus Wildermuthbacteria bacterium]
MLEFPLSDKRGRQFRLKTSPQEVEFQEVFLDALAQQQRAEELGERKLEIPLSHRVMRALFIAFFGIVSVFMLKAFAMQTFSHDAFALASQKNSARRISLLSGRGVIYDSAMKQLVYNKPSYDLVCDKRDMPQQRAQKEELLSLIASYAGKTQGELKKQFDENDYPELLVKEHLSHEELVVLEAKAGELPSCRARENIVREYAGQGAFSALLGYTAKVTGEELQAYEGYDVSDLIGKSGVEKSYESLLRGTPGAIVEEKNSQGATIRRFQEASSEPGKSLALWLDAGLQNTIQSSLQKVFQDTGTRKAAAVALDPNTGGVLAMVSLPTFDNSIFSKGISRDAWNTLAKNPLQSLFNRTMAGIGYPTGSVVKPLIAAAALKEGIIDERTKIFAPLDLCVKNRYGGQDDCFSDWTFHGWTDVKRAIAESVNPFFYIIGGGYEDRKGLGAAKIKEYLQLFGWGGKTGIDLPGEGEGILPDIGKQWRLGDTYHFSIGQGAFSVPPLQVASAFAAIANGGTLYQPQVAQKVLDDKKNIMETFEPKQLKSAIMPEHILDIVKEGMRQTVTAGSATHWLDQVPVAVAAKT